MYLLSLLLYFYTLTYFGLYEFSHYVVLPLRLFYNLSCCAPPLYLLLKFLRFRRAVELSPRLLTRVFHRYLLLASMTTIIMLSLEASLPIIFFSSTEQGMRLFIESIPMGCVHDVDCLVKEATSYINTRLS